MEGDSWTGIEGDDIFKCRKWIARQGMRDRVRLRRKWRLDIDREKEREIEGERERGRGGFMIIGIKSFQC